MRNAETLQPIEILDYEHDPRLSTGTRDFLRILNTSGSPALETLSPQEAQQVLSNAQASVDVDYSGIEVSEKTISSEGLSISLHVIRPAGVKEKLPVFVFNHGGGWVLGDFPTHKRMVRDLVVLSEMACVFVNYTRTSDAPFPVAINEIYAATKWVAEHGDEINVDSSKLAIVGNSVGANMSAVTVLRANEMNGPKISGLIMMWPIVDADFERDTYKEFGEQRFLTTPLMKWMYDLYIPDPEKRKDIYASPINASIEQLKGFPPTLIQVAENDVLREEGEAFGRKLDEAGVKVTTVRYLGTIHDFGLLNNLAYLPATRSLFTHAACELKKYLK